MCSRAGRAGKANGEVFAVLLAVVILLSALPNLRTTSSAARPPMSSTLLPFLSNATYVGPSAPSNPISLTFALRLDTAGMVGYLNSTKDSISANYHRYLTHGAVMRTYGPSQSATNSVGEWLAAQGLGSPGLHFGDELVVNTTVGRAEEVLKLSINTYRYQGSVFYANSVDLSLPSEHFPSAHVDRGAQRLRGASDVYR